MNSAEDAIINEICVNLIDAMPQRILDFYRNIPGRRPSEHSINVSRILSEIDDVKAIELIKDIVDRSVFSILNLIDNNFDGRCIKSEFVFGDGDDEVQHEFVERYRIVMDPGGIRR